MTTVRSMYEEIMIHTYNGILSTHKKGCGTDTCYIVDKLLEQYAQ